MHKYILKLTQYTEQGVPTSNVTFRPYDSAQSLSDAYTQYEKMRYTNEDGTVGLKMYRVEPMQGEYNVIQDWETFCSINKVLR